MSRPVPSDPRDSRTSPEERDVFVRHIQAQIASLRDEEQRLRTQEEALRARAADVRKRISEYLLSLDVYRREMGLASPWVEGPEEELGSRWADVAYSVMVRRGGRMKVADLVEELAARRATGDTSVRAEPKYATVYSSLKRDPRFESLGTGEFEIRTPSDAEVLQVVADSQLGHEFAGLKYLADQYGWHSKLAELIERGLLERYQVPNRRNPEFPTSAVRIVTAAPDVRRLMAPDLLARLEDRATRDSVP